MDIFKDLNIVAAVLILLGIVLLHIAEHHTKSRRLKIVFSLINLALHIGATVYYLTSGAGMDQLLVVLLVSLAVGLCKREK